MYMYEILFYCDNFELNQVDSISALIRETYANKLPRDLFRASIKENTKKKNNFNENSENLDYVFV